ncbi:MAG: HEPN domain-containing protein [Armatimonadetes bacterium]|nr:HEPN domain-containing protein [Armatimonadota bacterium]
MTEDQLDLLLQARDSISAARVLLSENYPDYAASRAYYAMFYIAEAFLLGEGLAFSKHSAVISAFGKEFAMTGRVPSEFHGFLIEAQELRHSADYGPRNFVEPTSAEEQINRAERFLDVAQEIIGPILSD